MKQITKMRLTYKLRLMPGEADIVAKVRQIDR